MTDPDFLIARYEHVRHPGGTTVYVHGEIDLRERPALCTALRGAEHGDRTVLVDLGDVTFMDSSGLHELADARRAAIGRGARFVVVAPPPPVLRLLHLWSDTDPFEIRAHRDDIRATSTGCSPGR